MNTGRIVKFLYTFMVFSFLYLPLIILIVYSFNSADYSTSGWKGFTLGWYAKFFQNQQLLQAMWNSFILAASSATSATVIGTLAAVGFFRFKYVGRKFNYALIYVVMMSPDVVIGISLLVFFTLIKLPTGFLTLLIAHTTFSLPFVVVALLSRLSDFDKNIVEASKDLGADEFRTFRYILLPLMIPAIASGWLLSFTLSMDDAIVSSFVNSPQYETLPIKILSAVKAGIRPDINALSTVIFIVSLILVLTAQFLMREKKSND